MNAEPGADPADGPDRPLARPVAVLVGPPGAGKSTVAAALAALLGGQVRDTDSDVEAAAGKSVADIFLDDGEPAFRELEREAVVRALASHPGVLSLGGGAVMDPLTEQALRGHAVVFLDVGIQAAARRIGFNRDRPLLIGNPRAQWMRLMENRRPVYERVATIRVETDRATPAELARQIAEALGLPVQEEAR